MFVDKIKSVGLHINSGVLSGSAFKLQAENSNLVITRGQKGEEKLVKSCRSVMILAEIGCMTFEDVKGVVLSGDGELIPNTEQICLCLFPISR